MRAAADAVGGGGLKIELDLAQRGQQGVGPIADALAPHVDEAPWHEVILLTVGYLGLVQQRDEAAGARLEELLAKARACRVRLRCWRAGR